MPNQTKYMIFAQVNDSFNLNHVDFDVFVE